MDRKSIAFAACVFASAGSGAWAQARVEISGTAGWTFSDGVKGEDLVVPDEGVFDRIEPADAFSWGARLGYLVNPNLEVGFLFSQQSSSLNIGGTRTIDIGDLAVRNYHGYLAYNIGEYEAVVRPYVLGGVGATQFGTVAGRYKDLRQDIEGSTKFSSTWAAGLKVFPFRNFGVRVEGRWTPTYVKSEAEGWWCGPFWGCYTIEDHLYSNQFEVSGGLTLRF